MCGLSKSFSHQSHNSHSAIAIVSLRVESVYILDCFEKPGFQRKRYFSVLRSPCVDQNAWAAATLVEAWLDATWKPPIDHRLLASREADEPDRDKTPSTAGEMTIRSMAVMMLTEY
ncbi:MAG: hypothetical protein AAGB11_06780 [Pseudomonadota bacterium]